MTTTTIDGEKEIVIPLDEEQPVCETKEEDISTQDKESGGTHLRLSENKQNTENIGIKKNTIEKKPITKLTDEDRDIIIANAKAGIDQPYYNVKFNTRGKAIITKKKDPQRSVTQRARDQISVANKGYAQQPIQESRVYYTDNQLLFEHIIDLNARIDKLVHKHKKLKRRYQTLQDDLYVEDTDASTPVHQENVKDDRISTLREGELSDAPPNVPLDASPSANSKPHIRSIKSNAAHGWRSQIAYL